MLAAIDLDDQSRRVTDEVGNEPADRRLTAKSILFGLPQSQHLPEPFLGFRHLAAGYAGAPVGSAASPPPQPSPIKGEGVIPTC
jgi:hypothetical protein